MTNPYTVTSYHPNTAETQPGGWTTPQLEMKDFATFNQAHEDANQRLKYMTTVIFKNCRLIAWYHYGDLQNPIRPEDKTPCHNLIILPTTPDR